MFYSLCIALCLAVMSLVFAAAVTLSIPAIKLARAALRTAPPRTQARAWLFLRLAPFALAAMVSLGLALPAFLEFEPPSTGEMVEWPLLALAAAGAALLLVVAVRLARMMFATRALERRWIARAQRFHVAGVWCPVYAVTDVESLLAVTGIFRPQVFVSREVAEALSQEELSAALAHELAHVRRFDNLQQLLLKSTQLPLGAFRAADAEWSSASEIAADEGAVHGGASALELSSALIKVGRLSGGQIAPARLAASHLVPCGCGGSTGERIAHLRRLLEIDDASWLAQRAADGPVRLGKIVTALAFSAAYVVGVGSLLPAVHKALEFLVR
ncbi:MAG TPA: M56 family metallopeptidase [Candidatus Angelobacter sp.]